MRRCIGKFSSAHLPHPGGVKGDAFTLAVFIGRFWSAPGIEQAFPIDRRAVETFRLIGENR